MSAEGMASLVASDTMRSQAHGGGEGEVNCSMKPPEFSIDGNWKPIDATAMSISRHLWATRNCSQGAEEIAQVLRLSRSEVETVLRHLEMVDLVTLDPAIHDRYCYRYNLHCFEDDKQVQFETALLNDRDFPAEPADTVWTGRND